MPERGSFHVRRVAVLVAALLAAAGPLHGQTGTPGGVGVVRPVLDAERPLRFFAAPAPGDAPATAEAVDSVTFATGDHAVEIATAPPWFAPEGLKLDYDLLWLRAETVTRDWIEVVVNSADPRPRFAPRTLWVAREAVHFEPWSTFLLTVFSVETLDPDTNPLRSSPSADAPAEESTATLPLRPLAIRGDWMRVEGADARELGLPRGWIRWWGDGRLLVSFSLLS